MARSQPITWRNVGIDNGASAAAFGNSAANFGRTAIQGLDIFSNQMQDRITREDQLLTNEAITAALSGGPQVSPNRRVDADALQLAVERQAQGRRADAENVRQERALEDDLLSSAVNRRLNTASAGIKEKDLETYDDRWALEQSTAQSESEYRSAQARIAEAELKLKQKDAADQERIAAGRAKMNQYLYGGEIDQQAEAAFQEQFGNDPRIQNLSPEELRLFKEQQKKNYRMSLFSDPEAARELYQRFGLQPIEAEQFTAFGQDAAAARRAAQEAFAERAALATEAEAATIKNINKFTGGNLNQLSYDGTDWTYDGGSEADSATIATTLRDMGLDPKDDKEFADAIKSKFKTATAFEAAARQIAGKYDGDLPDTQTVRDEVNALHGALVQRAKDRAKVQGEASYSADWIGAGNKYLDAMSSSSTSPSSVTDEEAGKATKGDPRLAREAILSINTAPQTRDEVKDSGEKLKLAVTGLKEARSDFKLPQDASRELRILFNRYKAAVDVADGGKYLPDITNIPGVAGPGYIPRPETPSFAVRREHAAQAADLLTQLQQQLESEAKAKKDRELRLELDNY